MSKEERKAIGTDHYGNEVFEGQVPVKDAHGNTVYRDSEEGADHLKEKHEGKPGARATGKKDAHGNEIWTSGESDEE